MCDQQKTKTNQKNGHPDFGVTSQFIGRNFPKSNTLSNCIVSNSIDEIIVKKIVIK
tara:strand:- start:38 stop:205 length:168 start_codon:yes stop_codon:yes gene_type:complete